MADSITIKTKKYGDVVLRKGDILKFNQQDGHRYKETCQDFTAVGPLKVTRIDAWSVWFSPEPGCKFSFRSDPFNTSISSLKTKLEKGYISPDTPPPRQVFNLLDDQ